MSDPPVPPELRIDDLSSSSSPPRTPGSRPRPVTRSSVEDFNAPWQRSSIRIRRLPSQQTVASSRPISTAEEGRVSSGSGRPVSASGSIARDFAANLDVPGAGSSVTRPRAGSVGGDRLRYEPRNVDDEIQGNRRRSSSDPLRTWNTTHDSSGMPRRKPLPSSYMPNVAEEPSRFPIVETPQRPTLGVSADTTSPAGIGRRLSNATGMLKFPSFRPSSFVPPDPPTQSEQYEEDLVDVLDTVDPEVSTLNTLNNVQNSLFIPDLGRYLNRRPTYTLTRPIAIPQRPLTSEKPLPADKPLPEAPSPQLEGAIPEEQDKIEHENEQQPEVSRTITNFTLTSLTSRLDDAHFAVLPHGERLKGWSAEERAELDDHVRHLLHSRKEKFKRGMKGFRQYVSKPLGFFVTVYAILITLFGLAWVLFLIGWINVGGRKDYIVNVIDNIMVALFAIMGDGLAPFRIVDTYHMCFIAHYHHLTWRLRRERALPELKNPNDLPPLTINDQTDLESGEEKIGETSVLNPKQQQRLVHHQKKFSRSHTFYKPHETETHFAFPLRLLVAVVVLLDCHSILQIALGTCTWSISYHTRPFALTTVILCFSLTCNITAGILITVGDRKTRKKDVLERMFRQQLTVEAMHMMEIEKEKHKEEEELSGNINADTREEATPTSTSKVN